MHSTMALSVEAVAQGEGDEAAMVRAARQDANAFALLYQRYLARIYRYLRLHTVGEEEAADLTQQVFLRALAALPTYQERGLSFGAWLFRIARNAATDAHRRRRAVVSDAQLSDLPQPHGDGPEAVAIRHEDLSRLRRLLAQLGDDKRELLALRFEGGLTAKEIALAVGKSEAAVKQQLARLMKWLKENYHEG